MDNKPLVAISACLHGEAVRYDGCDKRLPLLEALQKEVVLLAICPEQEAGLGTPRPPVELVLTDRGLRATGRDDPALDVTDSLLQQRSQRYRQLLSEPLCGYVFKSRSPSCGLHSTPVHADGQPLYTDNGLFADGLVRLMPWLAVCEENFLAEERQLQEFITRCQIVHGILHREPEQTLINLHRQYEAITQTVDSNTREELEALAQSNQRRAYLQELWEALAAESDDGQSPEKTR